jgi:hypothetical protein
MISLRPLYYAVAKIKKSRNAIKHMRDEKNKK